MFYYYYNNNNDDNNNDDVDDDDDDNDIFYDFLDNTISIKITIFGISLFCCFADLFFLKQQILYYI